MSKATPSKSMGMLALTLAGLLAVGTVAACSSGGSENAVAYEVGSSVGVSVVVPDGQKSGELDLLMPAGSGIYGLGGSVVSGSSDGSVEVTPLPQEGVERGSGAPNAFYSITGGTLKIRVTLAEPASGETAVEVRVNECTNMVSGDRIGECQ